MGASGKVVVLKRQRPLAEVAEQRPLAGVVRHAIVPAVMSKLVDVRDERCPLITDLSSVHRDTLSLAVDHKPTLSRQPQRRDPADERDQPFDVVDSDASRWQRPAVIAVERT